ncbi:ribonuclease H1 small subunit [Anaeromyces robustus]|uniref:Ribonuclease H1 small subunit n=1 Tax=Anaeromyces robustus TaxID=1754192 RepID=A0A1Y1VRZ1_9FUNG|nr:ribonuclease H1 small subunit [Anaeromyces robustus]|eukprot:ORX64051.1 ribonuclease H1 small subunit [Anaeromyces robustus]
MECIIDCKSLDDCKKIDSKKIHLLPCNIEYSGPAEVDSYFIIKDSKEKEKDQQVYISAFRGRGLKGIESEKTNNYTGYILKKYNVKDCYDEEYDDSVKNVLKAEKKFDSFMIWNHDYTPTINNNSCLQSLAWLEVASEINKF